MTDLENILEEFKTKENEEAVKEADEESTIENAVSPELAEQFTQDEAAIPNKETIEFDAELVEEYKGE